MKPLILNYTIERKKEENISLLYDAEESLSVIEVDGKKKPYIDFIDEKVYLLTKTRVQRESDDDDISSYYEFIEKKGEEMKYYQNSYYIGRTRTLVAREEDDESLSYYE